MKIRDYIVKLNRDHRAARIARLIGLNAPAIIIEAERKAEAKWQDGTVKFRGDATLLDAEFETVERRTGRGGKVFFVFNSSIAYFPKARYGQFITSLSQEQRQ